jgi:hypothetical protein
VIYLADWPDIYIHTNKDLPGNLDSTKMKRAMFIAAASAWYLANLDAEHPRSVASLHSEQLQRAAEVERRVRALRETGAPDDDVEALWRSYKASYEGVLQSLQSFGPFIIGDEGRLLNALSLARPITPSGPVYRRNPDLKGPMDGFGYSWLDDHLKKAGIARPALLDREPVWDGPSFGYETLNLVDGKRSVGEIRDVLAATIGPAPVEEVAAYLAVLERLGVVRR